MALFVDEGWDDVEIETLAEALTEGVGVAVGDAEEDEDPPPPLLFALSALIMSDARSA